MTRDVARSAVVLVAALVAAAACVRGAFLLAEWAGWFAVALVAAVVAYSFDGSPDDGGDG